MIDPIDRQAALEALLEKGQRSKRYRLGEFWELNFDEIREAMATVPSAHGDAEFISWLLDEVWDDEMWELNYRAFPELLCRRLMRLGYLKEEGGKYVRLDKQTDNQITVCPMCPDCPDNCPLETEKYVKPEPRWIPCSERLPEALEEVLVTSKRGYVYTSRIVHGEFEYGGEVIAWMPLPKPYERSEDE